MTQYKVLNPEEIDYRWPEIAKFLEPVVDVSFGEVTLDGIYSRLINMQEILLAVFESEKLTCACVLGITQFETGKRVLQMPYVGGAGIETWLSDGFKVIREIASSTGCTHIRGCGREGWGRVLPDLKRIRSIYECEV